MTTSISGYYPSSYSKFSIYLGNAGLFQLFTFQGWKYQICLYKTLQTKKMHGDAKKGMDHKFSFQRISIIFQKVNSKWYLLIQSPSLNLRWTRFTCNLGSNKVGTRVWVKYDHPVFTHFPCLIAPKCKLFQTI